MLEAITAIALYIVMMASIFTAGVYLLTRTDDILNSMKRAHDKMNVFGIEQDVDAYDEINIVMYKMVGIFFVVVPICVTLFMLSILLREDAVIVW